MELARTYITPLGHILDCETDKLTKKDALIVATYLTVIIPLACIACVYTSFWLNRSIESESTSGFEFWAKKILADHGNIKAQILVAEFYLKAPEYSYAESLPHVAKYYKMAADLGDANAQDSLARLYYYTAIDDLYPKNCNSLKIEFLDFEVAKHYFTLASNQNLSAFRYLGRISLYENRQEEAREYFLKTKSNPKSKADVDKRMGKEYYYMAFNYMNVPSVENNKKVIAYLSEAAKLGNDNAREKLASINKDGILS